MQRNVIKVTLKYCYFRLLRITMQRSQIVIVLSSSVGNSVIARPITDYRIKGDSFTGLIVDRLKNLFILFRFTRFWRNYWALALMTN